jgi:hypothetical protein
MHLVLIIVTVRLYHPIVEIRLMLLMIKRRYRVTSVQTVAPPPSSLLHAAIARAPATAMENVVARWRGFEALPFC